jgi:adenylate kinase family enzyme
VQRISVIGSAGAGKTTLARELSRRLDLPHIELDSIAHQPGWTLLERGLFQQRVSERVAAKRWVSCGNYGSHGVAPLVWARADTIVWLDLPRVVVTARTLTRSLRRLLTRQELWNGNRERLENLLSHKPEDNIVLWAWTRHEHVRSKYARMIDEGAWAGRTVYRLRTAREVRAFLTRCPPRQPIAPSSR